MTRITAFLAAGAAALALTAAGCGDDDSSSDTDSAAAVSTAAAPSDTGAATSGPAETDAAPSSGSAVAVTVKDFKFGPADLQAKVGEKITWTNEDSAEHDVTADSGADFASERLAQGDTFSFTPTAAGTIAYECTLHPGMTATITVS